MRVLEDENQCHSQFAFFVPCAGLGLLHLAALAKSSFSSPWILQCSQILLSMSCCCWRCVRDRWPVLIDVYVAKAPVRTDAGSQAALLLLFLACVL